MLALYRIHEFIFLCFFYQKYRVARLMQEAPGGTQFFFFFNLLINNVTNQIYIILFTRTLKM